MKPIQFIPATGAFLLSAVLLLPACSSDESTTSIIPANAIVLTEANAAETLKDAVAIGELIQSIIEAAIGSFPICISGSVIDNGSTVINGDIETTSGMVTATNCEVSSNSFINGSVNYSIVLNTATSAETDSVSGNVSFSDSGDTGTISNLIISGTSDGVGNYTTDSFSFTASSSAGNGFAATLAATITGNDADICPTTGSILVTGGQNTQVKGTLIISGVDVTIELNTGTGFNEIANSPVTCTTIFF